MVEDLRSGGVANETRIARRDPVWKSAPMLDQPLPVVVRPSTEQDVPLMVDIYAYHVQNGLGDYQPEPLRRRTSNGGARRC